MSMTPAKTLAMLFVGVFLIHSGAEQPIVRSRPLVVQPGKTGFTALAHQLTGLAFTNRLDELTSARNRTLENGAGVAAGDFDADGDPDLFLCDLSGGSALFENLGNWRFRNTTAAAALPINSFPARGAVFADINADFRPDLLLATLADGVRIFTNSLGSKFIESTATAGTRSSSGATTLALADVDRNGTLDLYVTTYRADDIRDRARIDIQRIGGKVTVAPALRDRVVLTSTGLFEFGEPDILYLNDGHGKFTAANGHFLTEQNGAAAPPALDWGLAASFRDMNADGFPDLYVCNDYWTPDRVWLNHSGRFHPLSPTALAHGSENSMGVDFADINADGHLDFFVTDMLSRDPARRHRQAVAEAVLPPELAHIATRPHYMQNMLFVNRGDGSYAEIAEFGGVAASEWSWQPVFMDVDLDGFPDLLIPAGHTYDVQDLNATQKVRALQHAWPPGMDSAQMQAAFTRELMEHRRLYPRYDAPIVAFRNEGNLTFSDMTSEWVPAAPGIHQGMACADFDGDGDQDFVVNKLNSPALLFRNDSSAARVIVQLRGPAPNTQSVGARVSLVSESIPPQVQEITAGGRYLSGFDMALTFAAGKGTNTLRVIWPSLAESTLSVTANVRYEIHFTPVEPPHSH